MCLFYTVLLAFIRLLCVKQVPILWASCSICSLWLARSSEANADLISQSSELWVTSHQSVMWPSRSQGNGFCLAPLQGRVGQRSLVKPAAADLWVCVCVCGLFSEVVVQIASSTAFTELAAVFDHKVRSGATSPTFQVESLAFQLRKTKKKFLGTQNFLFPSSNILHSRL